MSLRIAVSLLVVAACTQDDPGTDFDDGKGDSSSKVRNLSGHKLKLSDLHDPIVKLVLNDAHPPTKFADVIAHLNTTDKDCQPGAQGVALVSETSQLLGKPDRFRGVFTRACGGRLPQELLFAPQSSLAAGEDLPDEVEIMAFDKKTGAYDFWAVENGQWRFFGTSKDLLAGPGDGAGGDQQRRCANCHTGGGPIMKELTLPWANWDGPTGIHFNGGTTSPGSTDLVTQLTKQLAMPDGGLAKLTGDKLQNIVQAGNDAWNATRLATLKDGDRKELLKPLFCTVEINLLAAPDYRGSLGLVPENFLVDESVLSTLGPAIPMTSTAYKAAITGAHQQMVGDAGTQLRDEKNHLLVDTAFAFNHPHRSFADTNYVEKLKAAGLVDDAFVEAVLGIDFTTPIFSKTRCDLLRFAPATGDIKDGFIKNLMQTSPAAGSPEQELLDALTGVTTDLQARIDTYLTKCAARGTADPTGLANDLIAVLSLRRAQARALPIVEHRELFPEDSLQTPATTRFDPATCTLVH